jgi:hypothetical protein
LEQTINLYQLTSVSGCQRVVNMGEICGVQTCRLKRSKATKFVSFHNISVIDDDEWRRALIHMLGRDFKKEVKPMSENLFICSRHFTPDSFSIPEEEFQNGLGIFFLVGGGELFDEFFCLSGD